MTYIVALTGGIGSGKSTVANEFAKWGVPIVDADIIARAVVEPGTPALAAIHARFGDAIINADGSLKRAALRERIFAAEHEKAWLNALLHPLIQAQTRQQWQAAQGPYLLWVVPLLVENGLHHFAHRVVVVDVDKKTQLTRLLARDRVSQQQAENILAAQATREQRLACADDVIDNSGRPDEWVAQVAVLHQRYLALAAAATDRTSNNE